MGNTFPRWRKDKGARGREALARSSRRQARMKGRKSGETWQKRLKKRKRTAGKRTLALPAFATCRSSPLYSVLGDIPCLWHFNVDPQTMNSNWWWTRTVFFFVFLDSGKLFIHSPNSVS